MHKKTLYSLLLLSASLSACSSSQFSANSTTVVSEGVAATSSFHNNPQLIAQQAKQSTGDQAIITQFSAANELIKQRQYALATNVLDSLNATQLSPSDSAKRQLFYAKIGLAQKNPNYSARTLKMINNSSELPVELQISYLDLSASTAQQLNQTVNSIKLRIQLQTLLPEAQQKQNSLTIWKQVQTLPAATLQSLSTNSSESILAGWAKLAAMMQAYGSSSPQELAAQLSQWREQYPNHPANQLLPASFNEIVSAEPIKNIALLLPLTGAFKDQAEAVMDGFLSAYHDLPQAQQPNIKVYDTGKSSVADLYKEAIADGAQFVVGPLTKPEVQTIINQGACSVPTLLLNYTEVSAQLPTNCYEFGISPVDQAVEAANRAWADNYDQAVIIAPQGDWGQSIAASFKNQFQSLGGRVITELDFDQSNELAKQIAILMGVDQSNQRAESLQKLLGQKIKFIPRRRDDIGVIFLVATNAQAREIIPLLKFNFSENIPILATSLIYNGVPNPAMDRDLSGVRFLIMPWSINDSAQQQQLQELWATNFRNNSSLYGFGIDSLDLMFELPRMQLFPQRAIPGVTGKLTLQPTQQITQQMLWARFSDGKPILLGKKTHDR